MRILPPEPYGDNDSRNPLGSIIVLAFLMCCFYAVIYFAVFGG